MRLTYELTIDVARDIERTDPELADEIRDSAEQQDRDWSEMVRRFVGGYLNNAENALGSTLPEGFAVRIDDVEPFRQVTEL